MLMTFMAYPSLKFGLLSPFNTPHNLILYMSRDERSQVSYMQSFNSLHRSIYLPVLKVKIIWNWKGIPLSLKVHQRAHYTMGSVIYGRVFFYKREDVTLKSDVWSNGKKVALTSLKRGRSWTRDIEMGENHNLFSDYIITAFFTLFFIFRLQKTFLFCFKRVSSKCVQVNSCYLTKKT